MSKPKQALIAGAGGYGQVYWHYLVHDLGYQVTGFLDDDESTIGKIVKGAPVVGATSDYHLCKGCDLFISIGNNGARIRIAGEARDAGVSTPPLIHPTALVPPGTVLGQGTALLPGTLLMPYVTIGDDCIVSMGAKVAHHTQLERGVFVSTGANVGASILLREGAFVGIGATLMTGVQVVGSRAIVGAGAVVIRDVDDGVTVAGVPAKPVARR